MPRKPDNDRWVLTSSMASATGVPRICYCEDGSTSEYRRSWAKFFTHEDAREWAEEKGIVIDGVRCYPVKWTFQPIELM